MYGEQGSGGTAGPPKLGSEGLSDLAGSDEVQPPATPCPDQRLACDDRGASDQHASGDTFRLADEIHEPVDSVAEVDIDMARRPEERLCSWRTAPMGMARRVVLPVGLRLDNAQK